MFLIKNKSINCVKYNFPKSGLNYKINISDIEQTNLTACVIDLIIYYNDYSLNLRWSHVCLYIMITFIYRQQN